MTDNEQIQIEGMQKIIEKMYEKTDAITTTDIINRFVKEGYHKTIWYKVADGDLPEEYQEVRFVINTGHYRNGCYVKVKNAFYYDGDIKYNLDEVVAWTELPKYKE